MLVIFSVLWFRINFQHFLPRTTEWGVTWFRAQLYQHIWNWNFADKMLLLYGHSWGQVFHGARGVSVIYTAVNGAIRPGVGRAAWFILRTQWFVTQGAQAMAAIADEVIPNTHSFLTRSVKMIFPILLQHHISKLPSYFWFILCSWVRASWINVNNCPTRLRLYTVLLYFLQTALHVSDDTLIHHQEHT